MSNNKVPLIINNRNRLSTLRKLVDWFDKKTNLIILDNNSTYEPLLDYYKSSSLNVVYLNENYGATALYEWKGHLQLGQRYFIYTDSDVLPKEDCPNDLIDYIIYCKKKYKNYNKVGISLEINDIPDYYLFKKEVVDWESKYWLKRNDDGLYVADVDTTFAAYDINNIASHERFVDKCLRTNRPYVARHFPWYLDFNSLSVEEKYYNKKADARLPNGKLVGMWTQKHKQFYKKIY